MQELTVQLEEDILRDCIAVHTKDPSLTKFRRLRGYLFQLLPGEDKLAIEDAIIHSLAKLSGDIVMYSFRENRASDLYESRKLTAKHEQTIRRIHETVNAFIYSNSSQPFTAGDVKRVFEKGVGKRPQNTGWWLDLVSWKI